jgi:hypothetical protein
MEAKPPLGDAHHWFSPSLARTRILARLLRTSCCASGTGLSCAGVSGLAGSAIMDKVFS